MPAQYILALDQGTTSSRAIVFSHEGHIVSLAQQEFPQLYPSPGQVEHDPEAIWSSQLEVARQALQRATISAQGKKSTRELPRISVDLSATLSKTVQAHAADLDMLSGQLQTAVASINQTASTVKVTASRIDSAATSPEARSIVSDLSVAATELRHTSTQLRDPPRTSSSFRAQRQRVSCVTLRGPPQSRCWQWSKPLRGCSGRPRSRQKPQA